MVPEGSRDEINPSGPVKEKKTHNFGQNAAAQNDLKRSQNGLNCTYTHTYTRVHVKRLVITPRRGVIPPLRGGKGAGKPKDDRATAKKKRNVTGPHRGPV